MQRSLVIGASGFIGTRLVQRLVSQGSEVTALDIEPSRLQLPGVRYLTWDVRAPLELGDCQPSVIYNLAAVHRTPGHRPEEYYETNVLGALNVTAWAEAVGVETILFTSSISVYGETGEVLTEQSPLRPTSDYGRSKRMAEEIHRRWQSAGPNRRLVTARPGIVFGPGERGNYTRLIKSLRGGYFVYPGTRDTIKSGGAVDELLATFAFALNRPEPSITYNFAYPQMSSTAEIVAEIANIEGLTAGRPVAPASAVILAASVVRTLALPGLSTTFHPERVRKLITSTKVAPEWLISNGYRFDGDLEAGLRAWLAEDNSLQL